MFPKHNQSGRNAGCDAILGTGSPGLLEVSVIIPHRDDLTNLRSCLKALSLQTLEKGRFEVIVADNNSDCGIKAVLDTCFDLARVVPAPIPGAGEARNAGVRASGGRVLAFIDSDCRPSNDWLERGLEALQEADIIGGAIAIEVDDPFRPTACEAFEIVFAFNIERYVKREHFCSSGNMFVSRRLFDAIGGFRSAVSEDMDWCHRARALGYNLRFAPEVKVGHPARRDWQALERKWRRLIRESYLLNSEKSFPKARWILRSWLVLLSPFPHVPVIFTCPRLHNFTSRLKAIGVLFRLRLWRFFESNRILLAQAVIK